MSKSDCKRYNNYHKHDMMSSIFGMPDSATFQKEYVKRCVELGHTHYFTTNHGNMGNIFEAKNLCAEHGIACNSGLEGYIVVDPLEKDKSNYHFIVIPLTDNARKKLNVVNSRANIEGYYYKPRIFLEDLLRLPKEEFIITTACEGGILRDDISINQIFIPLANHFKNNIYLEVQNHNVNSQKSINEKCLYYADKLGLQLIAANDSHYIDESGKEKRNELLKGKHINYGDEGTYILDFPDYDTMFDRFKKQGVLTDSQIEIAINNTLVFDKCEEIQLDKEIKMPTIYGDLSLKERVKELKRQAKEKFDVIAKEESLTQDEINTRIEGMKEEIEVIEQTNDEIHTADYFLFNSKNVDLAVNKYGGVLTRSGRGSCGSFYLNKILGMTQIDRFTSPFPLYSSRFMSTARLLENRALPDIDFNVVSQEPFVKASRELLGENGCYPMIAYGTMQIGEAFRNVCRSHDIPFDEFNEIAKKVEDYKNDKKWKPLIKEAEGYVGVVVSASIHPCAYVLSDKNLLEEYGVVRIGDNICVMVTSGEADDFKLLKNDYLVVLVWKLISETFNSIDKPIITVRDLVNVIKDDKRIWDLFANGITCTLNQVDSDNGTTQSMRYKISSLREAGMIAAAIRPSFDSWREAFLRREKFSTGSTFLDKVLEPTDGFLIFQESLMSYFEALTVTPAESIGLIKKISKKKIKPEHFASLENRLVKAWTQKTGSIDLFYENWKTVQSCMAYGFAAPHALATGIDMCYGAYLKVNYPYEYYTVCFNNYLDDATRTKKLTNELDYFGIKLSNVRFRNSKAEYSFNKKMKTIYKGMASIKFLNSKISDELYELRDNKYDSFVDFLLDLLGKTSVNSRQLQILIETDFFEEFGGISKLSKITELFFALYDKTKKCFKKQLSKQKLAELILSKEIVKKYCHKEAEKTYMQLNVYGMLLDIEKNSQFAETTVFEKAHFQQVHLNSVDIVDKRYKGVAIVSDIDTKYSPKLSMYALANGNTIDVKISKRIFNRNQLEVGDVIMINNTIIKPRQTKNENGEWVDIPDSKVFWVTDYRKVTNRDLQEDE